MTDIADTVAANVDQATADDFLAGPRTFTIAAVDVDPDREQPVWIYLDGFDQRRPYKPSKSMRRVLLACWGGRSADYVGRALTLYRDPEVTFGRDKVGGIKISHLSHIKGPAQVALTVTRGKRSPYRVEPLVEPLVEQPKPDPVQQGVDWFASKGVDLAALEAHVDKPRAEWGPGELEALKADREKLIGGEPT